MPAAFVESVTVKAQPREGDGREGPPARPTYNTLPLAERFDAVVRMLHEAVIPAAKRQRGFSSFVVISNREKGKILSITFWETEADMRAGEEGEYFPEQVSRLISSLRGPPEIEHFEVDDAS